MCQTEAQMHVCQALWRHCILVFELGPVQDLTHWRIARILLTGAGEVPGELSSNLYPAPPLKTFFSLVAWNGILWWNFLLLEHSLQFITYANFFQIWRGIIHHCRPPSWGAFMSPSLWVGIHPCPPPSGYAVAYTRPVQTLTDQQQCHNYSNTSTHDSVYEAVMMKSEQEFTWGVFNSSPVE